MKTHVLMLLLSSAILIKAAPAAEPDGTKAADGASAASPAKEPVGADATIPPLEPVQAARAAEKKAPGDVFLSAGLGDVVKMNDAGIAPSIIKAFIESSSAADHPSAAEIIYLRERGLSEDLITALLRRGGELRDRAAQAKAARTAPALAAPQPPPVPAPAPAPPPAAPVYTYGAYAAAAAPPPVIYASPVYNYSYVPAPSVYIVGGHSRTYYRPSASFNYCSPRFSYGLSVGSGSFGYAPAYGRSAWGSARCR